MVRDVQLLARNRSRALLWRAELATALTCAEIPHYRVADVRVIIAPKNLGRKAVIVTNLGTTAVYIGSWGARRCSPEFFWLHEKPETKGVYSSAGLGAFIFY